jgi:PPP family 3-phenylpropionic acid transporter
MLRVFYICYFIVIGVSTPFFPAYLRRIGLSGQTVSAILAIAPALQLGVPLVWGWLADRSRRPDRVLRVLCAGACVASVPLIFVRSMPALFLLYVGQQIFAGSITAMADSIAVEKSRRGDHSYTRIRLWGSLSFVATSLGVGVLLDGRAIRAGDVLVPALVSFGFAASFVAALRLQGRQSHQRPPLRDVGQLLREPRFRLLLLIAGLHWMGLVPFHGFFGILMQDRGMSATTTSQAFMAGASAEVVVFVFFAKLRRRFSLPSLFVASFAVAALHWWMVAYNRNPLMIVSTQLLHAMTFGLFWATSMAWLADSVPPPLRATGQMLFSTTLGLGAVVGLLAVGAIYDATGGASAAFCAAGSLEVIPLVLIVVHWRRQRRGAPAVVALVDPN